MRPLHVLMLSDDYPGHHNFADGVLAAIKRIRPVTCDTIYVRGVLAYRMQAVRPLVGGGPAALRLALRAGFGISARKLPKADLVISGGGNTLAANVAAARLLNVPNIFCGSLRGGLRPEQFSLVVSSYEQLSEAGHIATLKPSIYPPELFDRPPHRLPYGRHNRPQLAGLLVGGNSGRISYRRDEWTKLISFLREVSDAWGTRWLISTSRRTKDQVADDFARLAKDDRIVDYFVDFRTAGPGTLLEIFKRAEIMVCTTDSSSMVSEAIAVHLPVVSVSPDALTFKPEEEEYRRVLAANDWCRDIPLRNLNVQSLSAALAEIRPPSESNLDRLAEALKRKLPELLEEN